MNYMLIYHRLISIDDQPDLNAVEFTPEYMQRLLREAKSIPIELIDSKVPEKISILERSIEISTKKQKNNHLIINFSL